MSYDEKLAVLKGRLKGVVKFDDLSQAQAYAIVHKKPTTDPAWKSLCARADNVLQFPQQYGVADLLRQIGGCDDARRSALREVIRQLASEWLEHHHKPLSAVLAGRA